MEKNYEMMNAVINGFVNKTDVERLTRSAWRFTNKEDEYQECYRCRELFEEPDRPLYLEKMVNAIVKNLSPKCAEQIEWALFVAGSITDSEKKENCFQTIFKSFKVNDVLNIFNESLDKMIIFLTKRVSLEEKNGMLRFLLEFFKNEAEIVYAQETTILLKEELSFVDECILKLKVLEKKMPVYREYAKKSDILKKMMELAVVLPETDKNYWLDKILSYFHESTEKSAGAYEEMVKLAILLPSEKKDEWLNKTLFNHYSSKIVLLLSDDKRGKKIKDYFNSSLKNSNLERSLDLLRIASKQLKQKMIKEMFVLEDRSYGLVNNFIKYFQAAAFLPKSERISFFEDVLVNWHTDRFWWRKVEKLSVKEKLVEAVTPLEGILVYDSNYEEYLEEQDDNNQFLETSWTNSIDEETINKFSSYWIAFLCASKLPYSFGRESWIKMISASLIRNLDYLDLGFLYNPKEDKLDMSVDGLGDGIELFCFLKEKEQSILAEKIINYCLKIIPYFLSKSADVKNFTEKEIGESKKYFEIIIPLLKFLDKNKSNEYVVKMANFFEVAPLWLLELHTLNKKINFLIGKLKSVSSLKDSALSVEDKKSLLEIVGDVIFESKQEEKVIEVGTTLDKTENISPSIIFIEKENNGRQGLKKLSAAIDEMKKGDAIRYSIDGILKTIKKIDDHRSFCYSVHSEADEKINDWCSKIEVLTPLLGGKWSVTDELYPLAKEYFVHERECCRTEDEVKAFFYELLFSQGASVAYDVSKGINSRIENILLRLLKSGITDKGSKNISRTWFLRNL